MPAKKKYKVKADNTIHNGEGGYFKKGDELPEDADVDSLKAKGLID